MAPTRARCWPPAGPGCTALIVKASHGHLGADRARAVACRRGRRGRALRRSPGDRLDGPGRRGRHRGAAAPRRPRRSSSLTRRNAKSPTGTPTWRGLARSLPGAGRRRRPGPGRRDRRPGGPVPAPGRRSESYTGLAPRASETGNTDRKGQPMSKAGIQLVAHHLDPRRGQRPQAGPATGQDLLRADGRTRRRAPQSAVRGRRGARRTALSGLSAQQVGQDERDRVVRGVREHRGPVDALSAPWRSAPHRSKAAISRWNS